MRESSKLSKFIVLYATANEKKGYEEDRKNLSRLASYDSGMDSIDILIAVSEVTERTARDLDFIRFAEKLFQDHPVIKLKEVFFKPNIGRDFSSYGEMLRRIQPFCKSDDYLLFLNRSARGPYRQDWGSLFINQYEKHPNIGLCGSTINLIGQKANAFSNDLLPHVQTYSFLTQVNRIIDIIRNFPAENITDRNDLIYQGEIGLSKYILNLGYGITSLEWPDIAIYKGVTIPNYLPRKDIKKEVRQKHIFYHRKYFKKNLFFRYYLKLKSIFLKGTS